MYFNGTWTYPFNASVTSDERFHATTSDQIVKMMKKTATLSFVLTDRFAMVDLPYGNEAFSMAILLPETDEAVLDLEAWKELTNNLYKKDVTLYLPRFEFSTSLNLKEAAQALGIKQAFLDSADFNGMANSPLVISKLAQKNSISVDESGAVATSASVATMGETAIAEAYDDVYKFTVDRPFIYVIHEKSTGAILFIGQVNSI